MLDPNMLAYLVGDPVPEPKPEPKPTKPEPEPKPRRTAATPKPRRSGPQPAASRPAFDQAGDWRTDPLPTDPLDLANEMELHAHRMREVAKLIRAKYRARKLIRMARLLRREGVSRAEVRERLTTLFRQD